MTQWNSWKLELVRLLASDIADFQVSINDCIFKSKLRYAVLYNQCAGWLIVILICSNAG